DLLGELFLLGERGAAMLAAALLLEPVEDLERLACGGELRARAVHALLRHPALGRGGAEAKLRGVTLAVCAHHRGRPRGLLRELALRQLQGALARLARLDGSAVRGDAAAELGLGLLLGVGTQPLDGIESEGELLHDGAGMTPGATKAAPESR